VHTVLPCLVRGGADNTSLGRVAVATDNYWPALELRVAEDLDRRDELVEVDVQHPRGHVSFWRVTTTFLAVPDEVAVIVVMSTLVTMGRHLASHR
jgi:hypothetical protein